MASLVSQLCCSTPSVLATLLARDPPAKPAKPGPGVEERPQDPATAPGASAAAAPGVLRLDTFLAKLLDRSEWTEALVQTLFSAQLSTARERLPLPPPPLGRLAA